jgi:hypothetical protein
VADEGLVASDRRQRRQGGLGRRAEDGKGIADLMPSRWFAVLSIF